MKTVPEINKTGIVITVLAFGYRTNKTIETYLDLVAQFTLTHYVRAIIIMGQYYDLPETYRRNLLRRGFYKTVTNYLYERGIVAPVFQSDGLETTSGNLKMVKSILAQRKIKVTDMVIFPGKFNRLKTRLAARRILGLWPNIQTLRPKKIENTHSSQPAQSPINPALHNANF